MKTTYRIFLITIWMLIGFSFVVSAQQYKIIVHNSNTTANLSKKQVSAYLLKRKTRWPDKKRVYPVDLSSRSSVRISFSKEIHRKSVSQVRAFWQQSVFAGKASPPSEKNNDQAVIQYVKTHQGAIGYISNKTKATGVKVINIK